MFFERFSWLNSPIRELSRFVLCLLALVGAHAVAQDIQVPVALRWVNAQSNEISIEAQGRGRFDWKKSGAAPFTPYIELSVRIPVGLKLTESSASAMRKEPKIEHTTTPGTQLLTFETISPLVSFRFRRGTGKTAESVGLLVELKPFAKGPVLHASCRNAGFSTEGAPEDAPYLFASLFCESTDTQTRVYLGISEDAEIVDVEGHGQSQSFRVRKRPATSAFSKKIVVRHKLTKRESTFVVVYDPRRESPWSLRAWAGPALVFLRGPGGSRASLALSASAEGEIRLSDRFSLLVPASAELVSLAPSVRVPGSAGLFGATPGVLWSGDKYSLYGGLALLHVAADRGLADQFGLGPVLGLRATGLLGERVQLWFRVGILGTKLANISFVNPLILLGARLPLADKGAWALWTFDAHYHRMELPAGRVAGVRGVDKLFFGLGREL